jgi:hypothetical protein
MACWQVRSHSVIVIRYRAGMWSICVIGVMHSRFVCCRGAELMAKSMPRPLLQLQHQTIFTFVATCALVFSCYAGGALSGKYLNGCDTSRSRHTLVHHTFSGSPASSLRFAI